jgi:hypothetical protein
MSTNSNMKRGQRGNANRHNKMQRDGDILVKKLTLPTTSLSTTAGGIIAVKTFDASLVETVPASEWASFAARYQQYRVRSVQMILEPRYPFTTAAPSGGGSGHGALYVGDYIGTATPTSAAQILSDEGSLVTNTCRRVVFTVDWARNPNAKLWNPTSAALPTSNTYGIAVSSSANSVMSASTAFFDVQLEWIVEFRGSQ